MVPINGYYTVPNDYYYLTEDGKVYRRKPNGKILECAVFVSKRGYRSVTLGNLRPRKEYIGRTSTVSRLMKWYYFNNRDPKVFINHIDGNKLNDHISNLELSDPLHNTHHAIDSGLFKATKITESIILKVREYAIDNMYNKDKISVTQLASKYGISFASCQRILNGTIRSMGLLDLYTDYCKKRTDKEIAEIQDHIKKNIPLYKLVKKYKMCYNVLKRWKTDINNNSTQM